MRTIHHTYGPHVDRAYLWKTLAVSYKTKTYVNGPAIEKLRESLKEYFGRSAALFASGRESLLALLRAIDVRPGAEIIMQGYTCVVVPNAIHTAGAVPVYADINPETLNLTVETVEPLITPRTKAIICQHTFGIPGPAKELRELCDGKGIILIEELAHAIPDQKGPKEIGSYGHALLLSFGRDKAISGIAGGAVLTSDPRTGAVLHELERAAVPLSWWQAAKLLEYPSRMHSIVRPLSGTPFLKPILWFLGKLGMIVRVVTAEEKKGRMSPILHAIPNACAELALYSFKKLKISNERRRVLTSLYLKHAKEKNWPILAGIRSGFPLQKFPVFVSDAQGKRAELKNENIHLDDGWTTCVICPEGTDIPEVGYEWGKDPEAERASMQILSLPTHPTMTMYQAQKLASRLDEMLG